MNYEEYIASQPPQLREKTKMKLHYSLARLFIILIQLPLKLLLRITTWIDGWFDYLYWETIRRERRLP